MSERVRSSVGGFLNRLNIVYEKRSIKPELRSRLSIEFAPEVERLSAVVGPLNLSGGAGYNQRRRYRDTAGGLIPRAKPELWPGQ